MSTTSTTTIVIIDKEGTMKKSSCSSISTIYKLCGHRKPDGFERLHTWENIQGSDDKILYHISVYGKQKGKSNSINKYELPSPLENDILYGSIAIVHQSSDNENQILSLSTSEWKSIYDNLFGGFENIKDEDDEDDEEDGEDELENIPQSMKTMHGYLKDGFIVDDEDEIEYDDEYDEENASDDDDEAMDEDEDGRTNNHKDDAMKEDEFKDDMISVSGSELGYESYDFE